MMFGSSDAFKYFECDHCGCLQISKIPSNLAIYYPTNYYSFNSRKEKRISFARSRLLNRLRQKKNSSMLLGRNRGKILSLLFKDSPLATLSKIHLNKETRVLDIGCGSGNLLSILREIGFKNLLGVDRFIEKDLQLKNGLNIKKGDIKIAKGKWDLIMFNHSFEHISNQLETVQSVSTLLDINGICLFNIPTVSSYAWRTYGINWVQLDAPRHFFLHSVKSLKMLNKQVNLHLKDMQYNSTDFQFWGSEQYSRGIPLYCDQSFAKNPSASPFSKNDIKKYRAKAKELNLTYQGDQAAFYFEKI